MPIDAMTLRRLLQARPDLAGVLGQGPTQATMPTSGGLMTGAPPADVLAGFAPESLTRQPEPAEQGFGGGLWNRVKGFFDVDEEADPAQQRYDADVSSAGWAGAARAAAEASANSQLSPIQVLTQALAGYSGAKQRARSELRGEAREERLFGLKERELQSEIETREAKQKQAADALARQEEVIASLPAEQQGPARALLAAGAKERFGDLIAPKPQNLIEVEGGGIFDPASRQFVVEPKVKPTAPFGSDALGYFQIGPDGQPVQVVGGLGRAGGDKPQIFGGQETGYFTLGPDGRPQQVVAGTPNASKLPPIGQLQAYRDSLPAGSAQRAEAQRAIDKAIEPGGEGSLTPIEKLIAARKRLAPDDPNREIIEQAIRKEVTSKEGTTIGFDENGNPIVQLAGGASGSALKPPTGYRFTDDKGTALEPIPGGPAEAASADVAGRLALLPGAKEDIETVRKLLIDPTTKKVNRQGIYSANPPIPFVGALPGEGREISSRIEAAVDTMVRLRSGASATENEMARLKGIYTPLPGDSDATVKNKIDRLERDLNASQEQFSRGKGGVGKAVQVPKTGAPPPDLPLVGSTALPSAVVPGTTLLPDDDDAARSKALFGDF